MKIPEQELFFNELNQFSQLHREVCLHHSTHVVAVGTQYAQLVRDYKQNIKPFVATMDDEAFKEHCLFYLQQLQGANAVFQQQITTTNAILGAHSNHWGSHVEQLGVNYLVQFLKTTYGVTTFVQKFKRYWDKNRSLEIDLIGYNATTAYVVEVKNQLKIEDYDQIEKIKIRLEEQAPEYGHLTKQFIVLCLSCTKEVIEQAPQALWIMQYKGVEQVKGGVKTEWASMKF